MPRSTRLALSLVIAFVLAAPGVAGAQAVPRGSSSGSGSSGSSSGSGSSGSTTSSSSGSSGGESNPSSSSSGGSGSSSVSREPSRIPTSGSHSPSRVAGATPRSAPEPGGIVSGARTAVARSGESESIRSSAPGGTAITSAGRSGPGRNVTGVAVPRRQPDLNFVAFPLYGPWGRWYPWYGSGFGWNLGFVYYNPWSYGATQWIWGRYGLWYDPWAYDPYWSSSYYSGYGYSSGYERHDNSNSKRMTGSIRLRASPSSASVYIDGALVGKVDEFDGFADHLELDGGMHQLELRAEGYETYRGQVDVEVGKTLTERISLKKIKEVK